MKYLFLSKGNSEIAINRDAIAYVSKTKKGTQIYLTSTDGEGKLLNFHVNDSFDDVTAMLNSAR